MDYIVRWDWPTLIFYLLLSLTCALLLKRALIYKMKPKYLKIFNFNIHYKYICYVFVLLILVFFMCTRVIKGELGGSDTLRYMYFFKTFNYIPFSISNILKMQGWEYLFFNFMYLVKILGGSYTSFSIVIYTLLFCCYIYYFDQNATNENEWFISLLFILPYLKCMNILRNCFAAAIGLISIEAIKKNKKALFFVTFIIAYLNHYISIVLLGFYLFCNFVPEKWYNNRKKTIIISLSTFIMTVMGIPIIKWLLSLTRYAGYINRIEFSPYGYFIYSIVYMMILLVYKDFIKTLKERNHMIYYKMIVFLSLVVAPFTVVNGTQRLLLYFEIPRFIMYGDLYSTYEKKVPQRYKKLFKYISIVLCILWIIFRIYRMYKSSWIMPYKNIYF